MNRSFLLVAMTAMAVVADTMLVPFYPVFFERVFAVTTGTHVGAYIAACCFTVMLAFPFWAWVARRCPVLHLLVVTQLAAALFSALCYLADSLWLFWVLSLTMIAFKGSYLLIYPLLMGEVSQARRSQTIGLLLVVVHAGTLLGATLGGAVLQYLEPRQVFLAMALGDLLQTALCLYLIARHPSPAPEASAGKHSDHQARPLPWNFILRLGLIMWLFYFGVFLIRPFFVPYWTWVSGLDSELIAGLVFALPGVVALVFFCTDYLRRHAPDPQRLIAPALMICLLGAMLQGSGHAGVVLFGRVLAGWGLFRANVLLDQLLYQVSQPASFAIDFSRVSFFQNLGVLVASFTAGALVDRAGMSMPFAVATGAFLLALLLYKAGFVRSPSVTGEIRKQT